jgi:copper chaperone
MNYTLTVNGMTCGHCEKAVARAIKQVDPQAEVKVDRSTSHVEVQTELSRDIVARAIADEGYAVAA